ncbi:E3 ubiquitin-protein ligase PDZRN3-B-like isoform X2 [Argopecten irradians]|uniref:E3 ubiquitin-protein ligase PDZRN3-B-like isoform X2 n=1 Tax=Argopecten irradians TaxID=31199 RepID=UPI0037149E86
MGFHVEKFVSKISEDKKCDLCQRVLDNPVSTPCGHKFCTGCILPWLVKHGKCPEKCRGLSPGQLESVLPLRESILNMEVHCEFRERGCTQVMKLCDAEGHSRECDFRPTLCGHDSCDAVLSVKELSQHQTQDCPYRPVGVCQQGCGLILQHNSSDKHKCLLALRAHIAIQDNKINSLELEMKRVLSKFSKREKSLLLTISNLQQELQNQAAEFQRILHDWSLQYNQADVYCAPFKLTLWRLNNSLGFNIMGGFSTEDDDNNNSRKTEDGCTEGIVVSKVMEGGSAEKTGLQVNDHIVKVNGQDLSKSSHEEAVEAFRTAQEPIVVEVLRRVNKNKMKNRSPTMVSIGTQTEEEIYGFNRPPTPPPPIFPFPTSGLYQPSSRRPVAFSASTEMGLTDIEMAHGFEYDDAYFDERGYDMEYEEVILHRSSISEKLGLTLCYGSVEEGMTDIFISEVETESVAFKNGQIREGDQILQINGIDVQSREQAIKLFSERGTDIRLLLARPAQLQGHFDEEGGTTDTATTENSLHKHEKDSGVGRTDESLRNEESSEQDVYESEFTNSPAATSKFRPNYKHLKDEQHYSDESFLSTEVVDQEGMVQMIPPDVCERFREDLARRCGEMRGGEVLVRKDSQSSIEQELAILNKEMEDIQLECQELANARIRDQSKGQQSPRDQTPYRSPRIVPRMGTRLEFMKHVQLYDQIDSLGRKDTLPSSIKGLTIGGKASSDKGDRDASTTSAYNTGESCRSTPLTLELNQTSDEGEKGFKNSMLCLAPIPSVPTMTSLSDTEKQTQTPCRSHESSSEDTFLAANTPSDSVPTGTPLLQQQKNKMGESLQDLYMKYADVMYTNQANLQHTIQIQQKLFQQQMDQKRPRNSGPYASSGSGSTHGLPPSGQSPGNATPPGSGEMEWVVKRRPDGTRYITRRPIRNKMLKERAKKISEERCGMTTDDDAMSELKTGRYWSKEDKKRHLEKAKDHKKRRELMMKAKMETLKETEEKKEVNVVELGHRKMMKHKGKKVFDDFTTVQEMLAHGSRVPEGKTYNPLLSVTTV